MILSILTTMLLLNPVVHHVKTTGYCGHPPCVAAKWADGRTASNTKARRGVCASNWKVFPRQSILWVPGYGICRVEDTGNPAFVHGRHLDLYFEDIDEARVWGVQYQTVIIVAWPPFQSR